MKNGTEHWFLIHIEVQGYQDSDFAKRMFQYAYRIMDRYGRPIAALAIFTDPNRTSSSIISALTIRHFLINLMKIFN